MVNSYWDFLSLQKKHNRTKFDCGNEELNQYLRKYAKQNDQKGISKTYVATKPPSSPTIDGYYTISTSTITFTSLPEDIARKLPNYPIPAILIGRLAVDLNCQGEGLGEELLVNALNRIVQISEEVGIYAVRVDAIDERAKQFYLKYEFISFVDQPLSLFLALKTIRHQFDLKFEPLV
jgi:predicted GNAT family N-acyltransferase